MRFTLILLSLLSLACTRHAPQSSPNPPPGSITHVVVFYLKSPGNESARKTLIQATQSFTQIPGVLAVQVGPVLPSPRPVVDSSFDIAAAITFKDEQALRDYDKHPLHQAALIGPLKDLVSKVTIYDFTNR